VLSSVARGWFVTIGGMICVTLHVFSGGGLDIVVPAQYDGTRMEVNRERGFVVQIIY
jgi:hypothetical protein